MNTTSTAAASVTPDRVNAANAAAVGSKSIKLTNAERSNLAHNLLVAMKSSGLSMDRFRRSNGVDISWGSISSALKGEAVGYFSKSLDIFGVLCGVTASEVLKPQSNRRPMAAPTYSAVVTVATETAAGRTPISVEGYSRNQPTGPRSNPVIKPVKVSAHTKVHGLRNAEQAQLNEPPAIKVGSVLFQIGTEVMYLPLANLKSMVVGADGTLTFTVKP
jgi:hypothetical protein